MMKFLVIFTTFALISCNQRAYQDHQVKTASFSDQKAIVVLNVHGKTSLIGISPKVSFDLVRVENFLEESAKQTCYRVKHLGLLNFGRPKTRFLMVEPGLYVIDNISWTSGNVTYEAPQDPIPSVIPVKYGAFRVEPGTVNYIGDLEFSCGKGHKLSITNRDRFEDALAELRAKHPEISQKLIKTEFLPGGCIPSNLKGHLKQN